MVATRTRCWLLALPLALVLVGGALATEESSPPPWLGIRIGGPSGAERGVGVARIFRGSPAERAGLRARDVIVAFDGQPLGSPGELIDRIRSHERGAWLPLTVVRQGDEIELDVRLGDRPANPRKAATRQGWIGVQAIELPETLREHFGAPTEAGVMISEVDEGSPAEAAGFRLGDVVYEIGEQPVGSLGALRELVAGGGVGNEYEFAVARHGALLVLEASIHARPPEAR